MNFKKRLFLIALAVTLIASYILPAFAAETKVDMFGSEPAPDGGRFKNTDEGWVGAKFTVTGGKLTGVVIPSWYAVPSSSIIILYRWGGNYADSLKNKPLYTGRIEDKEGSGWVDPGQKDFYVRFERAFSEGEYLLVILKDSGNALHVPAKSALNGTIAFIDGNEYANVSYQISGLVDPDAQLNENPNLTVELGAFKMPAYGTGASSDGLSYIQINNYDSVGHSFTVSGGSFTGLVINDLFVEDGVTAKVKLNVYKWNADYATTISKTPVFKGEYNCKKDADGYKDYVVDFGKAFPQDRYLVILSTEENMALWTHGTKTGITSYLNNQAYASGTFKLSYLADPNAEPVQEEPGTNPETSDSMVYLCLTVFMLSAASVLTKRKVRT